MDLSVVRADYANPRHAQALVAMLDACARDPAGGGVPLSMGHARFLQKWLE